MKFKTVTFAAFMVAWPALTPVQAQQFTSAADVRPILDVTRANWVSVREFDGKDLLYFTHLMSWRCGLDAIHYSVNGEPMKAWQGEGCYEGDAQPNALKAPDKPLYVVYPLGSIETVTIELEYDDGSTDSATYKRRAILMP